MPDGRWAHYIGNFDDGSMLGYGQVVYSIGEVLEGQFERDKLKQKDEIYDYNPNVELRAMKLDLHGYLNKEYDDLLS